MPSEAAQPALRNFFTIDLEDWFHANYAATPATSGPSTVVQNSAVLLDLLARHNVRATFFCLGKVALEHPELIRRIHGLGHEVASHGTAHALAYTQTPAEFRADVKASKERLEDLTGTAVLGYRAPSWSITRANLWALKELAELGFRYDSSIFPLATFLYGIPDAPRFPYVPEIGGKPLPLVEIPPSTYDVLGKRLGFAGGFYLRALPLPLQLRWAAGLNAAGHPFLLYVHPREIDPAQPRLDLPGKERLIHYYGIRRTAAKLEGFLARFAFGPIADALPSAEDAPWPARPVTKAL